MENAGLWYRSFGSPQETLALERSMIAPRASGMLRVQMLCAPINPSDLIPVTGAYRQRTILPQVAGYEGVGCVLEAPTTHQHLIGSRVLPLRGTGTWQHIVDCDPKWAISVPDVITNDVAARAYINPMAARVMLGKWPVAKKTVMLTGAGSTCADLLAQWAFAEGAKAVFGVYRSTDRVSALRAMGLDVISMYDLSGLRSAAIKADITFDCVGGALGSMILKNMRPGSELVGYGLLSGEPVLGHSQSGALLRRFHLRDWLLDSTENEWQTSFGVIWKNLKPSDLPPPKWFRLPDWEKALGHFGTSGRQTKPMFHLA